MTKETRNPVKRRTLRIAKNKEGVVGRVTLDFDGRRQRFYEAEKGE